MSDNNDIFADLTFDLEDFTLNDQTEQELKSLPQSDEKTPLTEQLKIWDQFQKITKDLKQNQQIIALTALITSPTSVDLQKKALLEIAQKPDITPDTWASIAAATKNGNENTMLAIADNLSNDTNKQLESFAIFENLVFSPKKGVQFRQLYDFTDRFVSKPESYLELLIKLTKQYPYSDKSETNLETMYTTLREVETPTKEAIENKNLKETIDKTAVAIYDIRKKYRIQEIEKHYTNLTKYYNITTPQNNNKTQTTPSHTR